ncbi:hypothetical protein QJS10_CPA05g01281 [Acorus calamus]|uniref:Uncharacterized protein n=1 Tax=Acorus calamus TaxID=4465 RepID=A0AAV9EUT7_ACOCL|nr:hypothetical protein QJS10_CPA05g01281 [Acorus calamus]
MYCELLMTDGSRRAPAPADLCSEHAGYCTSVQNEDEDLEVRQKSLKPFIPSWAIGPVMEEKQLYGPKTRRSLEIDPPPPPFV